MTGEELTGVTRRNRRSLAFVWAAWAASGTVGWILNQLWSVSNTPRDNIVAFVASASVTMAIGVAVTYPMRHAVSFRDLTLLAGAGAWIMSSALGWATSVKMGGALAGLATAVPFVLRRDPRATWVRGALAYAAAAMGIAVGYELPWAESIIGGATLPALGGAIALLLAARVIRFPSAPGFTIANMIGWNIVWVVAWAVVYGEWRLEFLPLVPAAEIAMAIAAGGLVAWATGARLPDQQWWHTLGWWSVAAIVSVLIGHLGAFAADALVVAVGFEAADSVLPATYAIGTGAGALVAFVMTSRDSAGRPQNHGMT